MENIELDYHDDKIYGKILVIIIFKDLKTKDNRKKTTKWKFNKGLKAINSNKKAKRKTKFSVCKTAGRDARYKSKFLPIQQCFHWISAMTTVSVHHSTSTIFNYRFDSSQRTRIEPIVLYVHKPK